MCIMGNGEARNKIYGQLKPWKLTNYQPKMENKDCIKGDMI